MSLMFDRWSWEVELSPVFEASDHAFVVEDLTACYSCDPASVKVSHGNGDD